MLGASQKKSEKIPEITEPKIIKNERNKNGTEFSKSYTIFKKKENCEEEILHM